MSSSSSSRPYLFSPCYACCLPNEDLAQRVECAAGECCVSVHKSCAARFKRRGTPLFRAADGVCFYCAGLSTIIKSQYDDHKVQITRPDQFKAIKNKLFASACRSHGCKKIAVLDGPMCMTTRAVVEAIPDAFVTIVNGSTDLTTSMRRTAQSISPNVKCVNQRFGEFARTTPLSSSFDAVDLDLCGNWRGSTAKALYPPEDVRRTLAHLIKKDTLGMRLLSVTVSWRGDEVDGRPDIPQWIDWLAEREGLTVNVVESHLYNRNQMQWILFEVMTHADSIAIEIDDE